MTRPQPEVPLRVLRIIARMNVGGPALQVTGLVEDLDRSQFEHRLLTGSVGDGEADFLELRAPHLPHTVVPGLGRSPRLLDDGRAFAAIRRCMREFRPHIVHTHTAKAGVLGRAAARTSGVAATVHTFHGHLLHGYFSPTVTRGVVAMERAFARSTTRLVAVGEQVRDDLLAAGIGQPHQYTVVPPGIELPAPPSRSEARDALGLPGRVPVVAFVARLTNVKRPERFIELARRLAVRHPEALFCVIGEGPLVPQLRSQAGPNVRFLGWRADVEVAYAASDLAVLCSDNEGMPVSLIEAAMCGVPAVATDVGSTGEVVINGQTGWLCSPDAGSLASKVDELLTHPAQMRRFGCAAREHATRSFGRARLVADTERLYRSIAVERRLVPGAAD
jgi:glycosyltransferase involved in cell wall biosynthesis